MIEMVLALYAEKVDTELKAYLEHKDCIQNTIFDAMNYSVKAGGKRLRPIIMLMTADMIGVNKNDVMPFACALEMIHTYSLIHDDLPAMDNDDLRRGKPTNHKVFGEGMAILAGDALLNASAEILTSAKYSVDSDVVIKAMYELYVASGINGMIGGQVVDIESEGKKISAELLKEIHRMKTGALLRAAGRIPAVLGGVSSEQLKAISDYCDNLGIAFQIQDDLLDAYGNQDDLGKPIGSDAENDKTTYVTLYGKEESERLVKEYTQTAINSLQMFGEKSKDLCSLAEYLTTRIK